MRRGTSPASAVDIGISLQSSSGRAGPAATDSRCWAACGMRILRSVLLVVMMLPCISGVGQGWTKTAAPPHRWACVACSGDGLKMMAVACDLDLGGGIFVSADSGGSWAETSAPLQFWSSIACSEDGIRLVAAVAQARSTNPGAIYVSADCGARWELTSVPNANWRCVAASADGSNLVAVASSEFPDSAMIYISTNAGAGWSLSSAPAQPWESVSCSPDGKRLVVAGGPVYISTNAGQSWAPCNSPPGPVNRVASSADGNTLVAANFYPGVNGRLYSSTNGGLNWRAADVPSTGWSVAVAANGGRLVAATVDRIYGSVDSGATWMPMPAPARAWWSVASSADGSTMLAGSLDGSGQGEIDTWQALPALSLMLMGSNLVVSWPSRAGDFTPEASSTIAGGGSWTPQTGAVPVGDRFFLTNAIRSTGEFFRLRR